MSKRIETYVMLRYINECIILIIIIKYITIWNLMWCPPQTVIKYIIIWHLMWCHPQTVIKYIIIWHLMWCPPQTVLTKRLTFQHVKDWLTPIISIYLWLSYIIASCDSRLCMKPWQKVYQSRCWIWFVSRLCYCGSRWCNKVCVPLCGSVDLTQTWTIQSAGIPCKIWFI